MTIEKAFAELLETTAFKDACKQRDGIGGKYRTYKARFAAGELRSGAMVETLLSFGYKVDVTKGTVKKK